MKPRHRRIAPVLSAVAMLATVPLVLAGCSGGSSASSGGKVDSITVLDYYNQGNDKKVIGEYLDKCGAENDVTIKRSLVPGSSLIQKVLQQASSKTLPDVLMLDNPDLQQIAETGALSPLSDYDISTDGYAKGVLQAGTYEDKVYGLAPTVNTIALFYNKKVLSEAGVTPPKTWDELQSTAAKLTKGDQYGFAVDANATYEGTWQFLPFMWSNGGDEKDIASPETEEALSLWKGLVDDGSMSKSVVNWTQADVNDQFMAGKAAMMINGPWQIPGLKESKVDYGIAQIPVQAASDKAVAPLGGEVWTVPNTGDKAKQAVAAKIVDCMNSDANQLAMAKLRYTIPSKTDVAQQFGKDVPEEQVFVDLVADARARTGELGADWPKAATKIYTAVQSALTGQDSPADALQNAQSSN
ncbi:sugar ABC transporter substrate-binding protein [Curtobacterium flaccumfaciens]|uniref:sugar ABC transporter substrate-binding protein n=1 Tax=Curtobacterium flaccumfaciens TaxID=2035 RepID=UPI001BDF000C|nr:ABC transporter substrate-binding protein [Curtobacterium flaccumfaciens]MBT1606523.1 ABC transporter substrate-binding protein [Curtobacterium flaccumfaciens pv. betae]MBT1655996.1 ABC transporter substrate-binding protein [Curtobacterium flaccumfaciens pv. betae]MCS0472797.1 ABC transporter substrate-binding protein [Curtobacterium flaccumfaciens pv. betae]MCS0475798.1 ABC transporter substrate-binding protein [Curtobacterium flaccumfaciens pv. betae]MCS0479637.1 ABC transporter substrate